MRVDYVDRGLLPPAHDLPAPTHIAATEAPVNADEEECEPIDEVVEGNASLARTRSNLLDIPQLHDERD